MLAKKTLLSRLENPSHWQECFYKVFVKVTYATNMALSPSGKTLSRLLVKAAFISCFPLNP